MDTTGRHGEARWRTVRTASDTGRHAAPDSRVPDPRVPDSRPPHRQGRVPGAPVPPPRRPATDQRSGRRRADEREAGAARADGTGSHRARDRYDVYDSDAYPATERSRPADDGATRSSRTGSSRTGSSRSGSSRSGSSRTGPYPADGARTGGYRDDRPPPGRPSEEVSRRSADPGRRDDGRDDGRVDGSRTGSHRVDGAAPAAYRGDGPGTGAYRVDGTGPHRSPGQDAGPPRAAGAAGRPSRTGAYRVEDPGGTGAYRVEHPGTGSHRVVDGEPRSSRTGGYRVDGPGTGSRRAVEEEPRPSRTGGYRVDGPGTGSHRAGGAAPPARRSEGTGGHRVDALGTGSHRVDGQGTGSHRAAGRGTGTQAAVPARAVPARPEPARPVSDRPVSDRPVSDRPEPGRAMSDRPEPTGTGSARVARTRSAPPLAPRPDRGTALRAVDLARVHGRGPGAVTALDGVSVDVERGGLVAVMGASGSGKSTLLHCLAGLDRPTRGTVHLGDTDLTRLSERRLTRLRRERVGMVFQGYDLLPQLTVKQNVTLPAEVARVRLDKEWLTTVLATLDLVKVQDRRPGELSGGQQQRVAMARALVLRPEVVLADEPTGALDAGTATVMLRFLRSCVEQLGRTVVMATHDPLAAEWADRVLLLDAGQVAAELRGASAHECLDALSQVQRPQIRRAPEPAAPGPAAPEPGAGPARARRRRRA